MKTISDPWIFWKIYSIEPMTKEEAVLYQTKEGFMPAGYGFQNFKCEKEFDGVKDRFRITWRCYSHCD